MILTTLANLKTVDGQRRKELSLARQGGSENPPFNRNSMVTLGL